MLLQKLKSQAVKKGLVRPGDEIDARMAFFLVRDMPYERATSREPETIIREWRGTCSGKHYLLKALFAELGYASRVILCTTVTKLDRQHTPEALHDLIERSNGRFVDAHNYLILELPAGDMIVDATWPLSTRGKGTVVNEEFVLGENQEIAAEPLQTWVVPNDRPPQQFKAEILQANFSSQELAFREEYIELLTGLFADN
jgi:hypothetical protein